MNNRILKTSYIPLQIVNGKDKISNFFYKDFKDTNLRLCRYTREENLSDLINGKLKVFTRGTFYDKRELGEYPIPLKFYIDGKITKENNEQATRLRQQIIDSKHLPTMCLSKWSNWDKYVLWNAYAKSKTDVCIVFTLKNLVKAIANNEFDFFMSKMTYTDILKNPTYDNVLFSKTPSYKEENEYRIYLQNKTDWQFGTENHTIINVDFELLRPTIIISPYADTDRCNQLLRKYPILENLIIKSKITENINKQQIN